MNKSTWAVGIVSAAALVGGGAATTGRAQQTEEPRTVRDPELQVQSEEQGGDEAGQEKPWYLEGGIDLRSEYLFRGYMQNRNGYIIQPYAEFGYTVYASEGDNPFTLTPYIGTWNNLTEEQGTSSREHWNEFDAFGGVDVTAGEFNLRLIYTLYNSPANAFDDIQEIGAVLTHPGGEIGPFASINPGVGVYQEVRDDNGSEDAYLELGLQPTLKDVPIGDLPLTLSFPLVFGASLNDYYLDADGDDTFCGFGQVGMRASVPLPLPTGYGEWTVAAEVDYVYLFADSAVETNDGDDDALVLVGNVTYSF